MKNKLFILLSLCLIIFCGIMKIYGINENSKKVKLIEYISTTSTTYTTETFSYSPKNGHSLEYHFDNHGKYKCKVQIYKKSIFGDLPVGNGFEVKANGNNSLKITNLNNNKFYIKITSTAGIGADIEGKITAKQLKS